MWTSCCRVTARCFGQWRESRYHGKLCATSRCGKTPKHAQVQATWLSSLQFIGAKKSTQTFLVQNFSTTLRVMDVRAENRGRPHQKMRFLRPGCGEKLFDPWVAIEVAIYRMGNGPEQKSRKNGKENGKWPHARNGRKMAAEMEKWTQKWDFGLILAIFSISAAIFRPFRAWGHFPFSFPFFRDFCSGPVSHSVNGYFNRNPWASGVRVRMSAGNPDQKIYVYAAFSSLNLVNGTDGGPQGRTEVNYRGSKTSEFLPVVKHPLRHTHEPLLKQNCSKHFYKHPLRVTNRLQATHVSVPNKL